MASWEDFTTGVSAYWSWLWDGETDIAGISEDDGMTAEERLAYLEAAREMDNYTPGNVVEAGTTAGLDGAGRAAGTVVDAAVGGLLKGSPLLLGALVVGGAILLFGNRREA